MEEILKRILWEIARLVILPVWGIIQHCCLRMDLLFSYATLWVLAGFNALNPAGAEGEISGNWSFRLPARGGRWILGIVFPFVFLASW